MLEMQTLRPMTADRRRQPRFDVDLRITLLSSKGKVIAEGNVRNISRTGARAERLPLGQGMFDWQHAPLVPSTQIYLGLHDPAEVEPLRLRAEVRWRRHGTLGLRFIQVPPEEETRLQRIIESVSATSSAT
jgi:hypothetical protein